MRTPTQEQFLKDVATHQVQILRDDGLYRHIQFRRPGTICMGFDLITYPGYLVYSGDMGCYVFSRLNDMFDFFRTDRRHQKPGELSINPGYWSEKLQAVDGGRRAGCATEFSSDRFIKAVHDWRVSWIREYRDVLSKEERRELWDAVHNEVLWHADDGNVRAFDAAMNFSHEVGGREFQFSDFWEVNCDEYTHRFMWCCYALAWGIQQYDKAKAAAQPQAELAQ